MLMTMIMSEYRNSYFFFGMGVILSIFSVPPAFPSIEVSGMSISQSIDAPMTTRDTVTMSGSLSSHNGTGSGKCDWKALLRTLCNTCCVLRWLHNVR